MNKTMSFVTWDSTFTTLFNSSILTHQLSMQFAKSPTVLADIGLYPYLPIPTYINIIMAQVGAILKKGMRSPLMTKCSAYLRISCKYTLSECSQIFHYP